MARIVALRAFNMADLFTNTFGDPSPLGINALALDYGQGIMRMWGSYDWNPTVGATSGNFRAMTYVEDGVAQLKINSFAANAVDFQEQGTALTGQALLADLMAGSDTLEGSRGGDRLFGFDGDDNLFGNGGNDALFGGNGNDRIFGGAGANRMDGGAGNDRIVGGEGADQMNGGAGADSMIGGFGDDVFLGGAGNDAMTGGRGADAFIFGTGSGRDIVYGFTAEDALVLDRAVTGGRELFEFVDQNAREFDNSVVLRLGEARVIFAGLTDKEALFQNLQLLEDFI